MSGGGRTLGSDPWSSARIAPVIPASANKGESSLLTSVTCSRVLMSCTRRSVWLADIGLAAQVAQCRNLRSRAPESRVLRDPRARAIRIRSALTRPGLDEHAGRVVGLAEVDIALHALG